MSSTEMVSDVDGDTGPESDNVFRGAWRSFTSSLRKEIAVVAGALAFVRLLAVSHLDLDTARAVLQHGDLTELAGGLVLSAALLWIPILVGTIAHGVLSMFQAEKVTRVRVVDGLVGGLSIVGIFLAFRFFDLEVSDLNEIARGGLSFGVVAALIGSGGAALVHYAQVSVAAERRALSDRIAAIGDTRQIPGAEPADEPAPPSPIPASDIADDVADVPPPQRSGWKQFSDRFSKVFRAVWFGAMSLWLILLAALVVVAVLTEPSQPAENITITQDGTTDTRTVHVIDDDGGEWIVMLRENRRILSVDASAVTDRYICRAVGISRRETRAVTAKTVMPMRIGAPMPPDSDTAYDAAEVERRGRELDDDVRRPAAERWVDRMSEQPAPCQPQWSSDEVAAVRRDLGLVCNDLGRCEALPATDP